jgi:hypothetical protein
MRKKIFPWAIALSALSVSGSAAFYSVYGLGKMFAGATTEVMILAGSLEFAKLVTASLLYQYWRTINLLLKTYLLIATLVLIGVTSAGIYGFLSSAYQETAFKVEGQEKLISLLDQKKSIVEREISSYESQFSQKSERVSQLTNIRSGLQASQDVLISQNKGTSSIRQQIKDVDSEIRRTDAEIQIINDSISAKNKRISEIEIEKIEISSDGDIAKEIGPLKYISGLTGKPLDVIVNWYILVLMLVFDPLAIALVIAANFAFEKSKAEKTKQDHDTEEEPLDTEKKTTEEEFKRSEKEENLTEPEKTENKIQKTDKDPQKTKDIFLETGEIKKIPIEENNKIEEISKEQTQKNKEDTKTSKPIDKYTRYIMENTPGYKGYRQKKD